MTTSPIERKDYYCAGFLGGTASASEGIMHLHKLPLAAVYPLHHCCYLVNQQEPF